jgi:maltooligosyltrehalose trehalohydrolase
LPIPSRRRRFPIRSLDWSRIDAERFAFYRGALAARREHVRPLLPEIEHGGRSAVFGEQAVRVVWQAGARRLTLDANLSDGRVAFPETTGVFWRCGDTEAEFGPWTVRWSVEAA